MKNDLLLQAAQSEIMAEKVRLEEEFKIKNDQLK